jgi:hypothetical protein
MRRCGFGSKDVLTDSMDSAKISESASAQFHIKNWRNIYQGREAKELHSDDADYSEYFKA